MSDDEADPELLELLHQSLGISTTVSNEVSSDTGVLQDAHHIYNNAIDVSIDMYGTKGAAAEIHKTMQERGYSVEAWGQHELHPKLSDGFSDVDIVNFIFTMDLQNFSFWSERSSDDRYQVEYRAERWTGYNSLVACLRRALDEGIPITTPMFWRSAACTDELISHVFRSATAEPIPLLEQRICILRESSDVLRESFGKQAAGEDDIISDADQALNTAEPTTSQSQIEHSSMKDTAPAPVEHVERNARSEVPPTPLEHSHFADSDGPQGRLLHEAGPDGHEATDITSSANQDGIAAPQMTSLGEVHAPSEAVPSQTESVFGLVSPIRHSDHLDDHAVVRFIQQADHSAGKLVNLLAQHFPCFDDKTRFEGRKVRLLKRAQILVADIWAALKGNGLGEFRDIGQLTMFADYRVPQSLHSLGVLVYSPPLDHHMRTLKPISSGHPWEVQLRGCSIWAVELIRREILTAHPEVEDSINAVLIDFFLYDLAKEREAQESPGGGDQGFRFAGYLVL